MRVKYFSDTDTALVEFTDNAVNETKEVSENIYVDLDVNGNLVSMTIDMHAPMPVSRNSPLSKLPIRHLEQHRR